MKKTYLAPEMSIEDASVEMILLTVSPETSVSVTSNVTIGGEDEENDDNDWVLN